MYITGSYSDFLLIKGEGVRTNEKTISIVKYGWSTNVSNKFCLNICITSFYTNFSWIKGGGSAHKWQNHIYSEVWTKHKRFQQILREHLHYRVLQRFIVNRRERECARWSTNLSNLFHRNIHTRTYESGIKLVGGGDGQHSTIILCFRVEHKRCTNVSNVNKLNISSWVRNVPCPQPLRRDASISREWSVHKRWNVVHIRAQTMLKRFQY